MDHLIPKHLHDLDRYRHRQHFDHRILVVHIAVSVLSAIHQPLQAIQAVGCHQAKLSQRKMLNRLKKCQQNQPKWMTANQVKMFRFQAHPEFKGNPKNQLLVQHGPLWQKCEFVMLVHRIVHIRRPNLEIQAHVNQPKIAIHHLLDMFRRLIVNFIHELQTNCK